MNTREIASEYRLSHWASVLQERNASGQSIKEYCKASGLREHVYYYWQRKIREAACEQLSVPGFAEVMLAEVPARAALPESNQPGQLQVAVAGLRITADSTYPADKLATLLRELTRPC